MEDQEGTTSGYLQKKRPRRTMGVISVWQQFYCILDEKKRALYYYKSHTRTQNPVGAIPVPLISAVKCDDGKSRSKIRFQLSLRGHTRLFQFRARSMLERDVWVLALRKALSAEDIPSAAPECSDNPIKFWKPGEYKRVLRNLEAERVINRADIAVSQKRDRVSSLLQAHQSRINSKSSIYKRSSNRSLTNIISMTSVVGTAAPSLRQSLASTKAGGTATWGVESHIARAACAPAGENVHRCSKSSESSETASLADDMTKIAAASPHAHVISQSQLNVKSETLPKF